MSSIQVSDLQGAKQQLVAQLLERNVLFGDDVLDVLNRAGSPEDIQMLSTLLQSLSAETAAVTAIGVQALLAQSIAIDASPSIVRLQQLFADTSTQTPVNFPQAPAQEDIPIPAPSNTKEIEPAPSVRIVFSYKDKPKKREVADFVSYFTNRYQKIKGILQQRTELMNLSSISRLRDRREREMISVIGLVLEKQVTKNGNITLLLEDPTGTMKVLINKNRPDLMVVAGDIVHDEVLGITGALGDGIVFANSVVFPDIPLHKEIKRSPDEVYAIFLSDIHIGSKKFLSAEFEKFLSWLRGETGSDAQRAIAQKVKYLFIMGDVVDGVGIFPGQEKELAITDIVKQYEELGAYLRQVPSHIQMIMCPGNHDAMRISEPQPTFYKDFSAAIHGIPNLTLVTNPGMVTIHASPTFSGFDVLVYHGYSFDHYIANVDSIRLNGGYDRADLIMKFLLQKRHLAPTHGSTLYIPDHTDDPLVIDRVPDFFATGHLHKTAVAQYRNVTLICGSCWQARTPFQEKMGHHPEPARVPIVNLKTREIKILRFDSMETEGTHG